MRFRRTVLMSAAALALPLAAASPAHADSSSSTDHRMGWSVSSPSGLTARPQTAAAAPSGYSVTGIDVAHYQGTINWSSVASSGIKFAYAKATEGTDYTDPTFSANQSGATGAGLYFGAYAYGRPDEGDAAGQADRLIDTSNYARDGKTLPPMLDLEGGSDCYNLSASALVSWVSGFVTEIKTRTGIAPLIYVNNDWWDPCTSENSSFGAYPLDIPNPASTAGPLPAGWSKWTVWQYSTTASVSGISGNTDADVFNGSIADLATWAGGSAQHGPLYDRTRSATGTWDTSARNIDTNRALVSTAAATLPDGSMVVYNVVPGSGVWARNRSAAGVWDTSATHIDKNPAIVDVAAAGLPDGTVHVFMLIPGSGVWDRTRDAAGAYQGSTKVDTNGSITAIAAAGFKDGSVHYADIVPGAGIYERKRSAAGVWDSSTTHPDTNGNITAIAMASLPDGSERLLTLVPKSGVYLRGRTAAGVWDASSTHPDTNGNIIAISAAGAPDGTLHTDSIVPGSGIWHHTYATSGAVTSTQIDTNPKLFDLYTAALADGTIHTGDLVSVTS